MNAAIPGGLALAIGLSLKDAVLCRGEPSEVALAGAEGANMKAFSSSGTKKAMPTHMCDSM
jgi:hypothetical protein